MNILALKPSHDGSSVLLEGNRLAWSMEAEKGNFPRYTHLTAEHIISILRLTSCVPDVLAISGWSKVGAGYHGVDESKIHTSPARIFGKKITFFSSTHERSHIWCAYGLSPFSDGRPCYCLVWEGLIGKFYRIERGKIHPFPTVMSGPGYRYAFLYSLGDPNYPRYFSGALDHGGKLMALAGMTDQSPRLSERQTVERILKLKVVNRHDPDSNSVLDRTAFRSTPVYNAGLTSPTFLRTAHNLHSRIFEIFFRFARKHLKRKLPLVIAGGCGLNCDWNSRWYQSGLFEDVFVPPCPNDSGSALGTAIDALQHFTGRAQVDWRIDCGLKFEFDISLPPDYQWEPLDYSKVATLLERGFIVPWVQGRYEIGPRALGFRSLLAAPFSIATKNLLNTIKHRESYRPVAPVCLEEDAERFFSGKNPSFLMSYTTKVRSPILRGITHADKSARLQTVNRDQNPYLYSLLAQFKSQTGFGVLSNTSLNFHRHGFINKLSDLIAFMEKSNMNICVIDRRILKRRTASK